MGNCMSEKSGHKKHKIKLNIKWTGIYDVDELFRAAAAPLQNLHDLSTSVKKSSKAFRRATFTHVVVGCTTIDSIYGMMYVFSANFDGAVKNLHFKVIDEPPYLAIKKKKLPQDIVVIYEAWEAFAQAIYSVPGSIRDLQPQIQALIEESKEFPDKAQQICRNNNLGLVEMAKATKRISKNVSKIANGKKVIEETQKLIEETLRDIQGFGSSYETNKGQIETIGKKAKTENTLHPNGLIPKYWPDQNRIDMNLNLPPKPKPSKK
ncbi:hypothetical protein SteCoe_36156 [Stentor coeruleus]|uniref:Uncharacterized protein n=1 Tax=Stentor coeruleus TaxID=5963 RepID=A0A1R2AQU5_9CILI|nr:hypothetical protein SteCoe_36156 [Stentor coeruleus]